MFAELMLGLVFPIMLGISGAAFLIYFGLILAGKNNMALFMKAVKIITMMSIGLGIADLVVLLLYYI